VLDVGARIPEATVWTLDRQPAQLAEVLDGKPALLLFYLFDFSST
jgi:hypothetical protein